MKTDWADGGGKRKWIDQKIGYDYNDAEAGCITDKTENGKSKYFVSPLIICRLSFFPKCINPVKWKRRTNKKIGEKNENTVIFSNMGVGWSTQTDRCSLFLYLLVFQCKLSNSISKCFILQMISQDWKKWRIFTTEPLIKITKYIQIGFLVKCYFLR